MQEQLQCKGCIEAVASTLSFEKTDLGMQEKRVSKPEVRNIASETIQVLSLQCL